MAEKDKRPIPLEFEKPLELLRQQIERLKEQLSNQPELGGDVERLEDQYTRLQKSLYSNLKPLDHLAIARHPHRPYTRDYFDRWDRDWVELHGDRQGADDDAMVCGLLRLDNDMKVIAVGTQKGRSLRDKQQCNFGMPQPEGYRKALRVFKHADKFDLPVVTLIDTPGAYPGLTAEEHNQAEAIAVNLMELAGLHVPVVSVVTGEGGSGGALAIGVANRILMLEHSVYSVISPEGCASILWKTKDRAMEAAQAMRITAREILELGVIDGVIEEPLGGAHQNPDVTAATAKEVVVAQIRELKKLSAEDVRKDRQRKFRAIGAFKE